MSIAIAFIGNNCGVVATDSQTTNNAGIITNSNFSKSFPLFDGLVAVAQTGLMDITLSAVRVYVKDIVVNLFVNQPTPTAFGSVVKTIKLDLTSWLSQNFTSIPAGLSRGVELLLVGREKITSGNYKIYAIDINERNINMGDYDAQSRSFRGYGARADSGDTNARAAINTIHSKTNFSNFNCNQLIDFI